MLRVFIGTDVRQPIAYHVLAHSILVNSSVPVSITPLKIETLPINRCGLTQFTFTRFLVPYLCKYMGNALFLDADMVVDADIAQLFELYDHKPVAVCKVSRAFERPSLMLFDNYQCQKLTPEYVETQNPFHLEDWASEIQYLPEDWNRCVGYSDSEVTPKLIHYTAGIPIWDETRNCKYASVWHKYWQGMNGSVSFNDLMGTSVHVEKVKTGAIN